MGLFNRWRPTMVELPKESGCYLVTEQQEDDRVCTVAYFDAVHKKWKYPYKVWGLKPHDLGWIKNMIVAWKKLPKTF